MATTSKVDTVERATKLLPSEDPRELIKDKIQVEPESCSKFPDSLLPVNVWWVKKNSFVGAVHTAYASHYPLVLTPDTIWQCVAQGFSIHVNKNAEKLREMFVSHQGKKKIQVRRDDFVKGSADNDWEECFGQFSEEIRKNVGDDIHALLTPEFSTTGPVERAAAQVVLMDTFKEYFEYVLHTRCGIPEITLEGTTGDWKKLRDKTLSLAKFDFQWFTDAVKPILDEFVEASSGNVNKEFWKTIYKRTDPGSGGPYITGWIVALFPYLGQSKEYMKQNPYLSSWNTAGMFHGVTSDRFPQGSVSTPFTWLYFNEEFSMYFYAGFVGVGQDRMTLALRPMIGWAVVDKEEEEKAKMQKRRSWW